MGIFKSFKKILKTAAPLIGGTIGFAIGGPLGSAAIGSALGAGIGSLAAGADTDDALKAALLGGIGGYAASGGKLFTAAAPSATAASGTQALTSSVTGNPVGGTVGAGPFPTVTSAPDPTFFQKALDFAKTPTGIATLGGVGTLAALGTEEEGEKQDVFKPRPDPIGETRLGLGFIGNKSYDLDDDEDRKKYFEDLRDRQIGTMTAANGGEVEGPGTGTSDSVPARLSDGEFVLTAKAVRGAGGGDRDIGAARMYEMMSELERVA
tara:strand:+ start:827 stop:1621 length:795 start_codon:yes stop_codon:yes gene_type:complete